MFALTAAGVFFLFALAALPGRIAARRQHPQAAAVNVCGWLGLPTGGFWLVALVWAYWNYDRPHGDTQMLTEQINNLEQAIAALEQRIQGGAQ
jgi:hypothetical protein